MKLRDIPLAHKMTVIIMVTSCTVLLLSSGALALYQSVEVKRELVQHLETLAEMVADNEMAALAFRDRRSATEVLQSLRADPDLLRAVVLQVDGSPFAEYRRAAQYQPWPQSRSDGTYFADGEVWRFESVVVGEEKIGTVFLASDLRRAQRRGSQVVILGLALAALFSVIAYLLASYLQRIISAPVLSLLGTAKRVAADKDFSIRASGEGRDELGLLVGAFNGMLADLQVRDGELQRHREHLEDEVENRTRELTETNTALRAAKEAAEAALQEVKALQRLLPICSYCKRIRTDKNYWEQLDSYVGEHWNVAFSHGVCPECLERFMRPELVEIEKKDQ